MELNTLWSLRLGYSTQQSQEIKSLGINKFLEKSFAASFDKSLPSFLENSPKTREELKELKEKLKTLTPEEKRENIQTEATVFTQMKAWWIKKIMEDAYPLREKMTCFWHNHYVATFQKVKINYWLYQHNQILRENAFGNFKDLTKEMVKSNAMVKYLDNSDNKKGKLNENLSRELLELFTLGIGNYTEQDIKNGAKGLAGLSPDGENATYKKVLQDNEEFIYFDKKGTFKADEMIDIIFEQPAVPYLITKKILQWFVYDNPSEEKVVYYGNYFRKENFEIKPLLTKIFSEEFTENNIGSKIKNPLEFILPIISDLNIEKPNETLIALFLRQQGMDLMNQPNVKGWDGGNSWLTAQIFLQRNNTADLLCNGKNLNRNKIKNTNNKTIPIQLKWNKNGNNKQIIAELTSKTLFEVNKNSQENFENILKYDFDSESEGANNAVIRLYNTMLKCPEYQVI